MTELEEQPVPSEARCPNCGGEPEPNPRHNLRALGYLHDDIMLRCEDCHLRWCAGRPIGDVPEEHQKEYHCDSCGQAYGRPNWITIRPHEGNASVTLKCPVCNYVWSVGRDLNQVGDSQTVAFFFGDPIISGEMDGVKKPWE